jgi:hemerythrin-like domain-containing protein
MKRPSLDLMREHEAIQIALNVIELMSERVRLDKGIDPEDVRDMIRFLRVFADECHHGKEELFLFPALEEIGVQKEGGPIGIMLAQHKRGRELVNQMALSLKSDSINKDAFVESASNYVSLLREHIEKENTLTFPFTDANLPESKQEELMSDFERLEKEVIGDGVHEELHTLLERFSLEYLK